MDKNHESSLSLTQTLTPTSPISPAAHYFCSQALCPLLYPSICFLNTNVLKSLPSLRTSATYSLHTGQLVSLLQGCLHRFISCASAQGPLV